MRSRRRIPILAALLVGAVVALAGCGSSSSPSPSKADSPTSRIVHTDQGDVTVPGVPQRVVVLNYALTGYLYNLDVPVVATTSEDFDYDAKFSELWGDHPKKHGTKFLTWGMDGFDYESILQLKPDLILAGGIGLPSALAVKGYDQLRKIAPTVIVSAKLSSWQDQLAFIAGDVLGRTDDYQKLLTAYQDRVAEVKKAIKLPPTPVATLTITADGTPFLLFEDRGLPKVLAELGFEPAPLVAKNNLPPYKEGGDMAELSTEQVGQLLADVPTLFITGFNADTTNVAALSAKPVWKALSAFANSHAYDLPYWVVRGDYDESMALLDRIKQQFS